MDKQTMDIFHNDIFKKEHIFLWGAGKFCMPFLTTYPYLYDIIEGIIDSDVKKSGMAYYGKRVYHYSELKLDEKCLIIIMSSLYYSSIVEQLARLGIKSDGYMKRGELESYLCSQIKTLDDSVKEHIMKYMQYPCGVSSWEDISLLLEAQAVKTVAFRIENVILTLPIVDRNNLYMLIASKSGYGEKLINVRKWASNYLSRQTTGKSLADIYEKIAEVLGLDAEEKKQLMELELEVYRQYIMIRESGKCLLEKVSKTKKVILYTSWIYPIEFIEQLLYEQGIIGYEKICVIEEGKFANFDQDCNENRNGIVYVGSDYLNDYVEQTARGYRSIWYPSANYTATQNGKFRKYMDDISQKMGNSLYWGYTINKVFDDPFCSYDSDTICNGDIKNFAKIFLAPILLEFVFWMNEDMERNGIKNLILVYRDGYLIEKIIQIFSQYMFKGIERKNAYLSRKVRYCAYAHEQYGFLNTIEDLPINEMMSVEEFAKTRLLVTEDEEMREVVEAIFNCVGREAKDRLGTFENYFPLLPYFDTIYKKNAAKKRDILGEYCGSLVSHPNNTAIFDIGYRGNVLRLFHQQFHLDCIGYHLFGKSFLQKKDDFWRDMRVFIKYSKKTMREAMILNPLMEDVICVQEGTAETVSKHNDKFIIEKSQKVVFNRDIEVIQETILSHLDEFARIVGEDCVRWDYDNMAEFEMLVDFLTEPNHKDAEILKKIKFCDSDFAVFKDVPNVYSAWYAEKFS